jgi:sigma-54 dependent transcriptional regulator, acetoin dehydrogenase operon transcriptional activator AcoR
MPADLTGSGTLPQDRGTPDAELPRGAQIVVALGCERPMEPPSRHALDGVDAVVIGRGAARSWERVVEEGERRLVLRVPDPRMSQTHARVVRLSDAFLVRDAKSRNGTFVNGARVEAAPLADGDLIEAGETLFLFRANVAAEGDATPSGPAGTGLLTLAPEMSAALTMIERLAPTPVSILVQAESGAGKEVVTRVLHRLSRRSGAYVAVNCGALPANLVETELFGYRRGAFSGATEDRAGLVRSAEGGTLFLDEIGDLSPPAQAALLRVLQEREVLPVGATRPFAVDVRFAAATHRDLEQMARTGAFRGDLLARIAGYTVRLPPLRERREDLGVLIASLLERIAGPRTPLVRFTTPAARALFRYDWPLNVRELEKCLEAAVALAGQGPIDLPHLPASVRATATPQKREGEPTLSEDHEKHKNELLALLRAHDFNVSAVARATGKARMQIQRWMRRYHIRPPR